MCTYSKKKSGGGGACMVLIISFPTSVLIGRGKSLILA